MLKSTYRNKWQTDSKISICNKFSQFYGLYVAEMQSYGFWL